MNLGVSEMLFIFVLALLIFGPKKLPEIGRQIGKALAEFRRASNEFKSQLEVEMRQIEIEEMLKKEKEEHTPSILPPEGTVAGSPVAAQTDLPSLPAAENEIRGESGNKLETENTVPESNPTEIKSEAVKSANG